MDRHVARWPLAALYALSGLLACVSLAFWSASTLVSHLHVSNFEGASGYAAMFQLPVWMLLYAGIFIVAYVLWLRRRLWLLATATVLLLFLAMPAISFIVQLALDVDISPGPLGRIE